MKSIILAATGFASAIALSPSAIAATFVPGDPEFQVSGDITSGPVSASIGNVGIEAGDFTDSFVFRIDQVGWGSGSLSTGTSVLGDATDVDIFSVMVNGMLAEKTISDDGLSEFFNISNVPIAFGELNEIVVTGFSRGNGSYGGNATFTPSAIPEPASWAMLIMGFGMIGMGLRYKSRPVKVSFS